MGFTDIFNASKPLYNTNVTAAELLPANRFVGFDGKQCAIGALAQGVTYHQIPDGKLDTIGVIGSMLIEASEPIAKGNKIASAADGKAKVATIGEEVNGVAYSAALAAGEMVEVLLRW